MVTNILRFGKAGNSSCRRSKSNCRLSADLAELIRAGPGRRQVQFRTRWPEAERHPTTTMLG